MERKTKPITRVLAICLMVVTLLGLSVGAFAARTNDEPPAGPEKTAIEDGMACALPSGETLSITEAEVPIKGWEYIATQFSEGHSAHTSFSFKVNPEELNGSDSIVVTMPESMVLNPVMHKFLVNKLTPDTTAIPDIADVTADKPVADVADVTVTPLEFTTEQNKYGGVNQMTVKIGSDITADDQIVIAATSGDYMTTYGDSHGGQTGGGVIGGGTVGKGQLYYSAPGVTLQVVYNYYSDVYNKEKSYNAIVKDPDSPVVGKWAMNANGVGNRTIFDGKCVTNYTVFADKNNGVVYELDVGNLGGFNTGWGNPDANNTRVPADLQDFFKRVIFGNNYGAWDKKDIGAQNSLYTRLLRYLGTPDHLIQNYLDAYNDQLDPHSSRDSGKLIPTIIWSYIVVENRGGRGTLLTPYDIYNPVPGMYINFDAYWDTTFTDTKVGSFQFTGLIAGKNGPVRQYPMSGNVHAATANYLQNSGCGNYTDSFCCCSMFGDHWGTARNAPPHKGASSPFPYIGTGLVNRIQADHVDQPDGQGNFYFFRNYWTPLGQKIGEPKPPTSDVSLKKSIDATPDCIALLKNNPMYSLAGAKYAIYADGVHQETITTDANGNAVSTQKYKIGTQLTIRETVAPPGFKLDNTPHYLTVKAGGAGANVIHVSDVPVADPIFAITKIDKNTTTPQGDSSFQGAIFKWEYFDNMNWSGTPKRTWYLETDRDGYQTFDEEFIADGYNSSDFYYGESGEPSFPLGTVKITEIKNPLGYTVVPHPLKLSIKQNGNNAAHEWTPESLQYIRDAAKGNFNVIEPIDTPMLGSLSVDKVDAITGTTPQGDATLKGAVFEVINNSANSVKIGDFPVAAPGQICYRFETNANGHHSSGAIFPLGKYTVREVTPPTGYLLETNAAPQWSKSFTISEGTRVHQFTANSGNPCANTPIMGGIRIIKQDKHLGENTTAEAPMNGIRFEIINMSENPVVVKGTTYANSEVVMTLPIAWDGTQWSASTGTSDLPYGTYAVKEVEAKPGMANDYYDLNTMVHTVEIRQQGAVLDVTHKNQIHPGRLEINKVDPLDRPLSDVEFKLEWSEDGRTWTPVAYNSLCTKGGCTSQNLKDDGRIVTDDNGFASFEGLYPTLQYRITETKTQNGYILLGEPVYTGILPITNDNINLKLSFEVVNGMAYTLPETGKTDLVFFSAGTMAVTMCAIAVGMTCCRRKRKNNS